LLFCSSFVPFARQSEDGLPVSPPRCHEQSYFPKLFYLPRQIPYQIRQLFWFFYLPVYFSDFNTPPLLRAK
jgi:hypothetical protein